MKITKPHYEILKAAINPAWIAPIKKEIKDGVRKCADPDIRLRWDCLWKAQNSSQEVVNTIKEIYKYGNDENIDTALRKIMKEITIKD